VFRCPCCQHDKGWLLQTRHVFECANCHIRHTFNCEKYRLLI
jgi:hypothetical protein